MMKPELPFISIGVRVVVNVEALNMVESVGNVVRHRVVPVIVQKSPGHYIVRWVPAVSGEALAHAYQIALRDVAREIGCSKYICYWCLRGEFLKHFDLEFYKIMREKGLLPSESEAGKVDETILAVARSAIGKTKASLTEVKEVEKVIVKNCIIEDIGGFLVTQGPVKRTSVFQFSWMIPTIDSIEAGAALLDNQFLVRHAPNAQAIAAQINWPQNKAQPQAPYYVQVASAVYAYTFNVNLDGICKSAIDDSPICTDDEECGRRCRALIAIEAFGRILEGQFGARKSRNLPFLEYEIVLALVSMKPLVVYAPTARFAEFVKYTCEIAENRGAVVLGYITSAKWSLIEEEVRRLERLEAEQKLSRDEKLRLEAFRKLIDLKNRGFLIISSDVRDFINRLKSVVEEIAKVKLSCPK